MKKLLLFLLVMSCSFLTEAQNGVKRVILFTIDGLHWDAPAKLKMPVFNQLIKEGTYIKQSYVIIPHHPKVGSYSTFNSCSFPNPVLHEGTIFLKPENKLIQEVFSPKEQTAFVVNSCAYKSIGKDFSTLIMDETLTDDQVLSYAIEILKDQHPVFMRIHLQTPGDKGYEVSQSLADKPYCRNIFYPQSPYVKAVEHADELLGQFVAYLKKTGLWERTVLIVSSDHGQSRIGWHPLFDEDSWRTPLVFIGQGIAKGRQLSYFEHTDLAPTIAELLGKEKPNTDGGSGKFVKAILENEEVSDYHPTENLKRINEQIKAYNFLRAQMVIASRKDSYFSNVVALLENESYIEPFYTQDRIVDWYKAGTTAHLIEINENVLKQMRKVIFENQL
jgi:acyl dehydratase